MSARHFFESIISRPKLVIIISILFIIFCLSAVPTLKKDTTADSFLNPENPALIYKDKVAKIFGLSDPMIMAIYHPDTIYDSEKLLLLKSLTDKIKRIDNIDPERVVSIVTEKNIVGTEDGLEVDEFFKVLPTSPALVQTLKEAIENFPLYQGSIVSKDGKMALIVAELLDENIAEQTYEDFRNLAQNTHLAEGVAIHIAGEGAINGYLGAYIDADAIKLNPLSAILITIIVFVAFRTWQAVLLPNIVVFATLVSAIGIMALANISFFVITNGLIVILIGIAVADSIHIFTQYYEVKAKYQDISAQEIVVRTMLDIWRPITLTTLTTVAGFLGLYFASEMPPFRYLGLFAAIGVIVAWVFSLFFLPAALSIMQPKPSYAYKNTKGIVKSDSFAQIMAKLGKFVMSYPKFVVIISVLIMTIGIIGALKVVVNDSRLNVFNESEDIYQADLTINAHMDGTNTLDIVLETEEINGLLKPEVMEKVEKLQTYISALNHIGGSTSYVDYLKQIYKAVNENQDSYYAIAQDQELNAQLFVLYSASGGPTDFEEEIDYEYKMANIRVNVKDHDYVSIKPVLAEIQNYIDNSFNDDEVRATITGRVKVNFHWVDAIGNSHFQSIIISLILVWLMAAIVFRSVLAGIFALIPVLSSILLIYALMGFTGISLGIGTSMFASVAIGIGVDFAIHTIDRIKYLFAQNSKNLDFDQVIYALFPGTGRALFFNFLSIGLGFAVLMLSDVVPLNNFGTIVLLAVTSSFIASMTLLPALLKLMRPAFINKQK